MSASWFTKLFGTPESKIFTTVQQNFVFDKTAGILHSNANGQSYRVGKFSMPTLSNLRSLALAELPQSPAARNGLRIQFDHIAMGDILPEHCKYPGALFQAASQFNCLEFSSPHGLPEHGVTNYAFDMTQGPACALACAAGTVVRNYFAEVPSLAAFTNQNQIGQSKDHQLNNLDKLEQVLDNQQHRYWAIVNGYTFSDHEEKLLKLGEIIKSKTASEYEDLIGHVKIGLHQDVGVNFRTRTDIINESEDIRVTQAYCSAISCAYSGTHNSYWAPFAQLVLDANYEATVWAGVLNYLQNFPSTVVSADTDVAPVTGGKDDPSKSDGQNESHPEAKHPDVIFLTMLGGGVFRNDHAWIACAIGRAIAAVEESVSQVLFDSGSSTHATSTVSAGNDVSNGDNNNNNDKNNNIFASIMSHTGTDYAPDGTASTGNPPASAKNDKFVAGTPRQPLVLKVRIVHYRRINQDFVDLVNTAVDLAKQKYLAKLTSNESL